MGAQLHLKTFHQDPALLFQFIFLECLCSNQHLIELLNLLAQGNECHRHKMVVANLIALVGATNGSEHLLTWRQKEGTLSKLKRYCTHFCQTFTSVPQQAYLMDKHANKAWLLGVECSNQTRNKKPLNSHDVKQVCKQIYALGANLKEMIISFKENENIIFFILRHHEQFDSFYRPGFVAKHLALIFPEGLQSAASFLIDRYSQRGFTHLTPKITKKFQEIAHP